MALTAKQEAFALAVVSGMNQSDAYRSAYNAENMKPETVQKRASELMGDGEVAGRVAELRAPVIAKVQYGLQEAMQEAAEAFEVAKAKDNGGAMVAAATLRAKLNGLLVDRKEVRTGPLDGMDFESVQAMHDAIDAIQRARAAKQSA